MQLKGQSLWQFINARPKRQAEVLSQSRVAFILPIESLASLDKRDCRERISGQDDSSWSPTSSIPSPIVIQSEPVFGLRPVFTADPLSWSLVLCAGRP